MFQEIMLFLAQILSFDLMPHQHHHTLCHRGIAMPINAVSESANFNPVPKLLLAGFARSDAFFSCRE